MTEKVIGMLPARMESSRLPGKPLKDICGLPMIVHVYQRCLQAESLDEVYVATDSQEIIDVIQQYGGKAIMTSKNHETGTDRLAEAAKGIECDIVVNIQGDEALVNPLYIDKVVNELKANPDVNVALLVNSYKKYNSPSDIKAVLNEQNDIMYLSRTDLPSNARTKNPGMYKAYHIVPFRKSFLLQYAQWPKGKLEQIEFNEYLRILEKGFKIRAVEVESDAVSVDTIDDLNFVISKMQDDPFFAKYRAIAFSER